MLVCRMLIECLGDYVSFQVKAGNTFHLLGSRADQRPLTNTYPTGSGVKRPRRKADIASVSGTKVNEVQICVRCFEIWLCFNGEARRSHFAD